jgi:hypothetical protein
MKKVMINLMEGTNVSGKGMMLSFFAGSIMGFMTWLLW